MLRLKGLLLALVPGDRPAASTRRRRCGHLWQNRFYSCALDERHLWVALRYVERNPVRASLVQRPEQYEWSSAAAHLGLAEGSEVLDGEFHVQCGGVERWAGLLAEPEELVAIRALQRGTFTGRPVGDDGFVEQLEKELCRSLAPHQGLRNDLSQTFAAAL